MSGIVNRIGLAVLRRTRNLWPDAAFIKAKWYFLMGCRLDLDDPRTFSEKLQWLKLNDRQPRYTDMVDKCAVKKYVAERIGDKYIIPTLAEYDSPADIDWESLPDRFVLKTSYGGGSKGVVVCTDKAALDRKKAEADLASAMTQDIYSTLREWPYKNVPRRILVEKYMSPTGAKAGDDLQDYKFFCFGGEPRFCQVIRNRHSGETIDIYDMDWKLQPFIGMNPNATHGAEPVPVPPGLADMIRVCRVLSEGIPFLRVDMYVIDSDVYFGELTFYPASGFRKFTPDEWNLKLGDMLVLPSKR